MDKHSPRSDKKNLDKCDFKEDSPVGVAHYFDEVITIIEYCSEGNHHWLYLSIITCTAILRLMRKFEIALLIIQNLYILE